MLYRVYLFVDFLARSLSLEICYLIAKVSAVVFYIVAPRKRATLKKNLRMVLGDNVTSKEIGEHALKVFKNFGKYLADFFRSAWYTREEILKDVTVEGSEQIDECLAEGKGLILLTLHLGNWELGGTVVAAKGYPVNAIVLEHKDERVNALFTRNRMKNNVMGIPLGIQVKQCFKILAENKILAVVGDKNYTGTGIFMDFFGKKALMPKGGAVFSLKTGAPIIICSIVRNSDDSIVMRFDKPIKPRRTHDIADDMETLMSECLRSFEKHIREYPDQWYAFDEIWKPEQITQ